MPRDRVDCAIEIIRAYFSRFSAISRAAEERVQKTLQELIRDVVEVQVTPRVFPDPFLRLVDSFDLDEHEREIRHTPGTLRDSPYTDPERLELALRILAVWHYEIFAIPRESRGPTPLLLPTLLAFDPEYLLLGAVAESMARAISTGRFPNPHGYAGRHPAPPPIPDGLLLKPPISPAALFKARRKMGRPRKRGTIAALATDLIEIEGRLKDLTLSGKKKGKGHVDPGDIINPVISSYFSGLMVKRDRRGGRSIDGNANRYPRLDARLQVILAAIESLDLRGAALEIVACKHDLERETIERKYVWSLAHARKLAAVAPEYDGPQIGIGGPTAVIERRDWPIVREPSLPR
jgi:hypothetical protein